MEIGGNGGSGRVCRTEDAETYGAAGDPGKMVYMVCGLPPEEREGSHSGHPLKFDVRETGWPAEHMGLGPKKGA